MRLNISTFTVALLATAYITSASAISFLSPGGPSCGEWVAERQKGLANNKEMWLLGFLSGMSLAHGTDYLKDVNAESIYLWVDNYCRANPLDQYVASGASLLNELGKKKTQ